ncbi:hypothetical protein [Paracoccus sp. (in: a-proteobacteria)]|uniref:hypothetical protein n=1 Tax=Paracoccus sp. TaxID=267 RepID=UPI0026DEE579|nr:hypothetical protein [Paracoccus sp. (in: a-proteobacteria)]MDO5647026.1 hypothetical protein [Paracoccus sp. (in: a-proteobacteria)]
MEPRAAIARFPAMMNAFTNPEAAMFRTLIRTARMTLAAGMAAVLAAPAMASIDQPVQAWSAMSGTTPAALMAQAPAMPLSDDAIDDQPYCASDAEIAMTLRHDFAENPVDTQQVAGAELWGSDVLGTWTLVAERDNDTSCIIASGIGYQDERAVTDYYVVSGLM